MNHGKILCQYHELVAIDDLNLNLKNPNKHSEKQLKTYAKILRQGVRKPVRVSNQSHLVTVGHGHIQASQLNGWTHVPVEYQDYASAEAEYADVVADNALAKQAELDLGLVNIEIPELGPDFDIELLGIDGFKIDPSEKQEPAEDPVKLADRFLVPPFSILDARQGYWQDRKRQWLSLGIKSELGRGGGGA